MTESKNPLIIPVDGSSGRLRCCPVCKKENFTGRRVQGMVLWHCHACGNKWHGGVGQEPADPTIPMPPQNPFDKPTVTYVKDKQGNAVEVIRPPSSVQEFRKGLPVPEGEE